MKWVNADGMEVEPDDARCWRTMMTGANTSCIIKKIIATKNDTPILP